MKEKIYRLFITLVLVLSSVIMSAQSTLTIEKIMQGDMFTGFSPSVIRWSPQSDKVYFNWNPDREKLSSLYAVAASCVTGVVPSNVIVGAPAVVTLTVRISWGALLPELSSQLYVTW